MAKKRPLIFLPAYNVEERVNVLFKGLETYREDVLFFNDGSTDKTYTVILENKFNCITSDKNRGVSNAIRRGVRFANENGYTEIVMMDSDGQHSPDYISDFIRLLNTSDIVVGNRFSTPNNILSSKLSSNLLASLIIEQISDRHIDDVTCGFKAFHISEDVEEIVNNANDYSIVFDLLLYFLKENLRISEIKMNASYFYDELLYTKYREIDSFLRAVFKFKPQLKDLSLFQQLRKNISLRKDFDIEISDILFYGYFLIGYDGYIIQCDQTTIGRRFNGNIMGLNNGV